MKSYRREKLSVLLVLFLGYVGFSLVFPILPPMFLNPEAGFLPSHLSYGMRNILLGTVLAMYPMGQFIGCPVLGKLSDRYGRRVILNITLFCTALMYMVTALSVVFPNITLLFLSRFFTGIFEGNITIANAVMADISRSPDDKTKNFGWITTFSSSGWVVGPLIGGVLADSNLVSWFTFSTPFWLAAIILFLCTLMVYFIFEETNQNKSTEKITLHLILSSMIRAYRLPTLKTVYATNGFFYIAMFMFFTFLPVWLIQRFGYNATAIGNFEAYLSVVICLAPFSYTTFSNRLAHKWTLVIATIGLGLSFIPFITLRPEFAIWFTVIPISYFIALGFSFGSILISDLVPASMQGEALGLNQSIMVLCESVVSLTGGFLVAIFLPLPFIVGILSALAGTTCILSLRMQPSKR